MMKAYPEYTDSLIEGIDNIPSNWNVMRFRHLFSIGRGLGITKENLQDDGIPCVNYGEIHSKYGFELDLEKHPLKCVHEGYLESSPSSLLNKGDLVYADTSEDLEGSGNFTQLVSDEKTFAGYHTVIARQTRNHDDRFLAYALDSDYCRNQIRRMVKGVKVFSITQAILKDTSILLPSYDEQRSISSFLDVNTSRIDNLIAEKQNFIKLLSEKRQALISHVVTKGLNPNVPMKDSGVEWIGEIPEHWVAKPIKYLGTLNPNKSELSEEYLQKTCSFVPMTKLKTGSLMLDEVKPVLEVFDGYTYFKDEDVLFAKVTPCFENKNMCIAKDLDNGIGFGSSEINVFRVNKLTDNRYFYYLIQEDHFMQFAKSNMTGTGGLKRVPSEVILDYKVAIPSIEEQREIADYLESKFKKLNELTNETNNSINLLKEHRTALISAAVTGKIDVREEV